MTSLRLVQIAFTVSEDEYYKGLPSMKIIFTHVSFFFLLLSFSSHTFSWACGSLREPRNIFSFCAFTCLSNNSFLDGFQPNLVQHFPHVCSTCHTVFSLKNTLEYFFERLLHCRLIFSITWTPDKCFAYTFSYTIYIDVSFCPES